MPTREFSRMILGAAWPLTEPEDWQSAADAQHAKGCELIKTGEQLRAEANRAAADQSGDAIDGYFQRLYREASKKDDEADKRFTISRVAAEIARLFYGEREDLDGIDRAAHEQIGEIRQSAHTFTSQLVMWQAIEATVMAAGEKAKETDIAAAAAITKHGTHIGIAGAGGHGQSASTAGDGGGAVLDPSEVNGFRGLGGGRGLGGIPQAPPGFGAKPGAPDLSGSSDTDGVKGHRGSGLSADHGQGDNVGGTAKNDDPSSHGVEAANNDRQGGPPSPRDMRGRELLPDNVFALPPPVLSSGTSDSTPSSPLRSATGGGLSGLKMPDTSSLSGMGVMGGMGQGLGSGTGPSPASAGMASAPAIPPPASPSSFSQGLGAGLGGAPAAPLVPPVTSAPTAAPAGPVLSGPASVAAAAGPAVSSPAPSPLAAPIASGGGAAGSAGPVGPLPPFGSDVRSAPVSGGGAFSPAAGSAPPPVSVDRGGSAAGSVAALPPGVVGSGVGAGAGATTEAVRSSLPDPLLESASQLVYQLVHASRVHGLFLDWCVGVFRTRSRVQMVIVNSEGAGCIPRGVFVPRAARMLFADPGLSPGFRARWFSWANPAETMLAFANWASEHVDLWALAVSTANGGSSAPARAAGVQHFEDCAVISSPISVDDPVMPLDEAHMHRLETLDRHLYARLTGVEGRRPDPSEAWLTTAAAAHEALGRACSLPDLLVPPVIREVLDLIGRGLQVAGERWEALRCAGYEASGMGAGLRPGRMLDDDAASPRVLAYHDLSRLIELLLLWDLDNDVDGPSMKYPEIAYLARQIKETTRRVAY